ncbi:MAG: carboxypeptidase regulatory-like domain-containing protein [Proteobacteria bacterium]|nr:carboxypeptidase regulatory-like domain-containing protein [Pseudomonadota bacterium]
MLSFAACGGSGGGNKGGGSTTVTVSGIVSYEFVPPNLNCSGLNMDNPVTRPIRGATVQLMDDASNTEITRTVSDDAGGYSFTNIPAGTMVYVQVLAELKRLGQGLPSWDVDVRDNVDTSGTPPLLGSRPLYALTGAAFDTGTFDVTENLLAATGWVANSYSEPRAAAPFAVLDTIYSVMQFILSVDPTANFPALDAFWSVNNTSDIDGDIDAGELGGAFYFNNQLFFTGDALYRTTEFDDHIVVHEWGHYFEENFSRSDSQGGTHFLGDQLDSRLAFGEGWATALAAMALGDPVYCSTGTPGTMDGFELNAEGGPAYSPYRGWFDEVSVLRFIYDIWDITDEGLDTGSIGFQPIYDVMTGPQITTEAWANVFTFATYLKAIVDQTGDDLIDSQLDEEGIDASMLNIWGDGETNQAGATVDVLPIYIDMTANDTVENICSNSQFDTRAEKDGNKLSEFRYIRLAVPATGEYHVTITATTVIVPDDPMNDRDQSDPDMYIYRDGVLVADLTSGVENLETTVPPEGLGPLSLVAGTYVADLRDWRYVDPERPATYPPIVCFDVRFTPTP